jgi:tetratricopeptide (TPR) repeat protein
MRRPIRIAAVVAFVIVFLVGFAPLFGPPGYEHALVSGLVAPSCAAIGAALALSRERLSPTAQLLRGCGAGALAAAAAFASALLHGLWSGFCSVGPAALYFLLTAGIGSVLGGAWGAFVAEGTRRARRPRLHAWLFGIAAPLLGVVVSIVRFYASPMVFAFDPFVGYFAGTLYDTVVEPGTALLTYRLGTFSTLAAAFAFAALLRRRDDGGLEIDRGRAHVGPLVFAAAAFAGASVAITLAGPALGHWQTPATIARALGGSSSGPRCNVLHGDEVPDDIAALTLRDCEEQLAAVERALGARGPERVTAYIFRDKNDKKRLMGAADTYIAKPWRHEVYLQAAPYPHPVLAHELAHVVAGSFGVGAFRVAGRFGGLLPNPGLIEGVAVAAAPEHDVLSDIEWSRAMLELGILPNLRGVFSLGFLGEASSKSYTVAGAVVRWLMETRGKEKIRALYGGQSPEVVLGASWQALDDAFRAHLRTITLSPEVLAYAKAKFDRPSVFGRTCPHEVDALVQEASACRESLRFEKALTLYEDALSRSTHEMPALLGRATTRLRMGDLERARLELERLAADDTAPRTTRDRAAEALGDADFREGRFAEASERYRTLATRVLDEDLGRTLEVKALLASDPLARGALEGLLLGLPGRAPDATVGLTRVETWRGKSGDPVADYLIGRNLLGKSNDDAVTALRRAVRGPLPTARIRREAARQLALAACITRAPPAASEAKAAIETEREAGAARGWYEDVNRQLEACGVF